jgi:nitroreductase
MKSATSTAGISPPADGPPSGVAGAAGPSAGSAARPPDADAPSRLQRSLLWRVKLRLQFTGWLQYLGPLAPAAALLVLAGVGAVLGIAPLLLVRLPLALAALLMLAVAFDVVTTRLDVRPREPHPPRLDDADVFDVMRARRACRSFQHRMLTDEDREALLGWAREHTLPASVLGHGPVRLEYVAVPLTVWPVVGAHEFLVAIAPKDYDRAAVVDVGRSLQKVVIEATRAGISTCWIGPGADQSSVVAALADRFDPDRDHVICVCAVGYRSRFVPLLIRGMNASMHRRLPLGRLFFADEELRRPVDTSDAPYDELGRCYEVCQWAPSSYNGQTTRAVVRGTGAVERVDFLTSTSSRYYAPVALGIWVANWEVGSEALGVPGHVVVLSPEDAPGAVPGGAHYGATWLRDPVPTSSRAARHPAA